MAFKNFEFKARTDDLELAEQKLLKLMPVFKGKDFQTDTYFKVKEGRLKLRESRLENALIYYRRTNAAVARKAQIILYKHQPDPNLKNILTTVHGILTVVCKQRKIYFIDNVKFHFDFLEGLGTFLEVEAIDEMGNIGLEELKNQCLYYQNYLDVAPELIIPLSYSDMILERAE